ncbi:MAG: DUF4292 domain-containing protein, partial [Ferruginibacter sp.]|nr:DUF4292 domain-containing protein [Ferruginibacter sp.]
MRIQHIIITLVCLFLFSCKTTKKISKAIAPKVPGITINNAEDSLRLLNQTLDSFKSRRIDFQTFSAKIKVESMDNKGKNPDISANVKIIKDSAIWISLTATIINIEVYRALITKDSVILLNKQDKEVVYRSVNYLQNVTQIPFDFYTLQDLIVGNPIFWSDSITSFKIKNDQVLLSSLGKYFKGIFALSYENKNILHCKLDDVD